MLMDFPKHVDRISMELPILYFKGSQVGISKLTYDAFLQRRSVFIFTNSADPDEHTS